MTLAAEYRECYTITAAAVNSPDLMGTASELADKIQTAYSGEGLPGVAGFFDVQRLGPVTVLTFQRNISDDLGCFTDEDAMTPWAVINQLANEFAEVQDHYPSASRSEEYMLLESIIQTLKGPATEVKGLLCQAARLKVMVELTFEDRSRMLSATRAGRLDSAAEALAKLLQGDVARCETITLTPVL